MLTQPSFSVGLFQAHYPDIFFDVMLQSRARTISPDALGFGFWGWFLEYPPLIPYKISLRAENLSWRLKNIKGLPKDFAGS